MKTKLNMRRKIFFLMLFVTLLLLAVLSIGTTLGKFSITIDPNKDPDKKLNLTGTITISPTELGSDPENPDRPGIEEEAPTSVYQVQPGDTLASIAEKYHVPVESLAACNDLDPAAPLTPGTVLHIPAEN